MTDQNTFMDTVKSVAEIMRTSAKPLTEEEVLTYFDDMELNDDQKKLVLEYLKNPQPEETAAGDMESGAGEDLDGLQPESEESSDESVVFKMYLEELSNLPSYSRAEEEQMYRAFVQGDNRMIQKLSDCWLERVLTIAKKYMEPELHIEDLVQEGNMALFVALQSLCGNAEQTDIERCLSEAVEAGILAYASERNSEQELERTILGRVNLIHEAKKLLTEENGTEPTLEELADYTKMPSEELEDVMDMIKTIDKQDRK